MKENAMEQVIDYFREHEEKFADAIEKLDNLCDYLGDDRLYPMCEIDDYLYGESPSEIIGMIDRNTAAFSLNDEYFYRDVYGLRSTNDREQHYRCFICDFVIRKIHGRVKKNELFVDDETREILSLLD